MKTELSERERKIFVEMTPMRSVLTLALPTVLSQIIVVIYNLADTYFVGRAADENMVAAITLSTPLFMLITGLANLFGIGGSSMMARCLGRAEFEKARRVSSFAVWGAAAVTVVYALVLLVLRDPLLRLCGADANTLAYSRSYMLWVSVIGALPTAMSAVLAHLIRAEGGARKASFGLSMGGILNMLLDPLFMFVLLPPGQEVTGAAIATMLSNLAATVYFVVHIQKKRRSSVVSLVPRQDCLREGIPGDVVSIGLPSFLMTILSSFSNAVAVRLMSGTSAAAIAGMGVAKKINMMAFRVSTGITQGSLPLIAYNHAAGDFRRMKKALVCTSVITIGFAAAWVTLTGAAGGQLIRFFIDEAETIAYGSVFIKIIGTVPPMVAISMIAIVVFQAAAEKRSATVLSVLRKGVLDIPLMFVFDRYWPVYGVAVATPVAEVVSVALAIGLMLRFIKRLGKTPQRESVG